MSTFEYILVFTLIGSVGSLIGGIILISGGKFALKISHFLSSFAAGTLLGTAFFDLLPESSQEAAKNGTDIFLWTLISMIIFFFIERFIRWFHHHEDFDPYTGERKTILPLIIIGDTAHNFLDGIVIAATFLVSIPLGAATTLAIATHEIPQEIGDFGLMLHRGMQKKKIILVNILSATAALAGAIITFLAGDILKNYIAVFLAMTAGFFIYIASSDLIPEIHYEKRKGYAIIETVMLLIGIAVIWLTVKYFGS